MVRFCAVAVLLLSAASLCSADTPPADDGSSTPWYNRIFGSSQPKPQPRPDPAAPKPITRKELTRSLKQEQDVYLERLQFCDKLREIALQTNDNPLALKADELEQKAYEVYQKRVTKPLPALVQEVKASEAALDQKSTPANGSASNSRVITGRAPNGKPIYSSNPTPTTANQE